MATAIQLQALTKQYANGRGIFDLSFSVAPGELFGYLGPNGAGKSTTIKSLMGFLTPERGSATINGQDVTTQSVAVRSQVGYLPSDLFLYDAMSGLEQISLSLQARGQSDLSRAKQIADRLEVDLGRKVKTLSRGQRQKVAITLAMAHDPAVLLFDEPTTGLDPMAQEILHGLMREEAGRGKTILFSSHILSEVEALCDRVAIIRDGRIVTVDQIARLKQNRVKRVSVEFTGPAPDLASIEGVREWKAESATRASFAWVGAPRALLTLLAAHDLTNIQIQDPSLEEVFMTFYASSKEER
ncbi:MAG TPA: ABC transporter ATP-binding protein [Symbiobacteriaceae bacterium]|nr:ABC transporter ATP-binding protein [Symbiobacteriaceae bacterium]